ncbi:MAG: hypothetical protein JSR77_09405 [Planctomycetes bacterium]|nr:hypothetical protein [Planctomycetota bacterium]
MSILALLAAASAAAYAQPANNACSAATVVGPGVYTGSTSTATNDGIAGCIGSASKDVWFKVVADRDLQLVVTACGSAFDTVLSIHTGCPGTASNAIACNDDSCGLQSQVSVTAVTGQEYYIRLGGYGVNDGGNFTLNVSYAEPPPPPTLGPDVWIEDLTDVAYYATLNGISSYAVGTDACNQGDTPVEWQADNNRHPVIAQNLFRLANGRFEQLGQSWLKHGFASTNSGACGTCVRPPNGGAQLGVNCSDAYGAGLNGSQGNLGPRSQVNVTTGVYPYPYTAPAFSGEIMRRIQVRSTDVAPASNPGALYFAECHYVTQDDAQWNNGLNNASYKRVSFATPTAPAWAGATQRQHAGIEAWPANDTGVTLTPFDYSVASPLPGRGPITARFWVGAKTTDNGNGTWTYEYAIENFNSDHAGGSFYVPLPAGAHLTNIGFHDVDSHSGEPYDNTDWTSEVTPFGITFKTLTYAQNQNANALRWGTLYNFRFTADVAPAAGNVSLGLFKPGGPIALNGPAPAPALRACVGDFNHDGGWDGADIGTFFQAWEAGVEAADTNGDGSVDGADAEVFFIAWEGGRCN